MIKLIWAGPGTLIGLLLGLFLSSGTSAKIGEVRFIPCKRLLPNWAAAQTWGEVILFKAIYDFETQTKIFKHELAHVDQWQILGPLFFVLYPLASLLALLTGGHYYKDNAFERDAREVAED
jgi:hypothetical protein